MKFSPDEEKTLEKAFDLYSRNVKYPSEEELSEIEFSPEFRERMEKLINGETPLKVHKRKRRVLQMVASVAVVFVLLAGGFAVGTFSEPLKQQKTVKDIIDLHNSFMYETEQVRSCYYGFSYVPEGYTEYSGGGDGNYISDGYKNENGDKILFIQYMEEIPIPEIDRFGAEYDEIDGGLYIFYTNTGKSRYIWSNLGYIFEIRTDNCSKEEIFKMRDSLVRK